eukprot:89090-Chlamydomonas_euryale.AAC.2
MQPGFPGSRVDGATSLMVGLGGGGACVGERKKGGRGTQLCSEDGDPPANARAPPCMPRPRFVSAKLVRSSPLPPRRPVSRHRSSPVRPRLAPLP